MKLKLLMYIIMLMSTYALSAFGECDTPSYYLQAEVGGSFARSADIVASPAFWDPAVEGYDASLHSAPLFGFGFGYHFYNWLAAGFSWNHRSKFRYQKFQTPIEGSTTPGFLGPKTRFFDLDNSSFMFNLFFNKANEDCYFAYDFCQVTLMPFAGFGIGWSKNTLYNFHSVTTETIDGNPNLIAVGSIMNPFTVNKFGWQIQVGIDFIVCHDIEIGFSYRYFDGGKFSSNNYLIDVSQEVPRPVAVDPWTGKLRANEFVANIGIQF